MNKISDEQILQAAEVIHSGGLIAYPTETYYGLGVDPFNEDALQRLFRVKNRPVLKPVLVLIASRRQLDMLTSSVPEDANMLMDRFWPGPVTMVLPARTALSPILTGNTTTVGVRLSPHPVASALLKASAIPLTATSANLSGDDPAVTADEVREIFGSDVDFVLDGGSTPGKCGSTLIGFDEKKVQCIREGMVPFQEILNAL